MDYRPNVKHETIKLLKDNVGENLDDLVHGNNFQTEHQGHDS